MRFNGWSMTKVAVLLAGVTLFASGGCQSLPQGVSQDAVMVGLADSGKLVRLAPGQQLVVELESNPVTGFQWEIDQQIDQNVLLPDGSRFKRTADPKRMQEEVGSQYLRFRGQQPGRTTLELVYVQPQVGTRADSPRYRLEVIVSPRPSENNAG
ncbi:MAG: protease inhibitor I42 family protein [Planctomycetota bacterium]|nr:protease inhibitor I42 family protein [Planctomycetota bacterium]